MDEEKPAFCHVIGKIPLTVWLVAFTGAAHRFAYYSIPFPWRKFYKLVVSFPITRRKPLAEYTPKSNAPWGY